MVIDWFWRRRRRRIPMIGLLTLGTTALVALTFLPVAARAGGVNFTDEDVSPADDGPSYFGFVREVNGPGVADAEVTASLKQGGAIATRTDILGVYKIPGFAKEINPDDVVISCAKKGYKQADVVRRPPGDAKDPIETECYLQKQ
jgi:hypothetical protein